MSEPAPSPISSAPPPRIGVLVEERTSGATFFAYLGAIGLVALTLGAAMGLRALLGLPDLEMLFLLTVFVAAVRFGRGPALTAAALGVACYDFFFVPPLHTFDVTDKRYFLTFAMMFGAGFVASEVTARLRRQQQEAVAREERMVAVAEERTRLAGVAHTAALRAKTEELRSSLLSAVSHDLRTPLASITGAATSLRDDANLPPRTREELVESICTEAVRLERLVANLLDMTRLESGAITLTRDWVPLEELVGSALTRLEERLGDRRVVIDLPADLPLVQVDPVLYAQVFVNLFENAAKYTPPGSPLTVRAWAEGQEVLVDVLDAGPGLPEADLERAFEKFQRGSHGGVPGVGLGLAICRGVVEAHGGSIHARNLPGGGAGFRLRIPLGAEPPPVPSTDSVKP